MFEKTRRHASTRNSVRPDRRSCPQRNEPRTTLRRRTIAVAAAAAAALLPLAPTARAVPLYWDSNGTTTGSGAPTGTWGTSAFWNTDPLGEAAGSFTATTTNADDVVFSAGTNGTTGTITVSGTVLANSIAFDDNVAITVSGGTGITLGGPANAGIFVLTGDNAANTVSTPITLAADAPALTFSNAGTGLLGVTGSLTGSAATGTQVITVSASSTGGIDLGGTGSVLSDGAGGGKVGLLIASTGTGLVTMKNTAANTFTGGVQIRSGTLFTNNGNAKSLADTNTVTLGDTAANSLAARWQMGGTVTTYTNPVVLNSGSTGVLSMGSANSGTNLTFSGGVTGTNNFAVTSSGGAASLTFANNATTNLAINNTGTFTNSGTGQNPTIVSGVIANTVTNVIQNSATSSLTLTGANAYTGTTTVSAGLLNFQATGALPGYSTSPATAFSKVTVTSGTLGLGYGTTAGLFTAADVASIFAPTSAVNLPASGASIGLDTFSASATYANNLANPTGKALGLTKLGANTLTLSGTNTYTGTTTVSGGVLRATDGASLPTGSLLTINGGVFETTANFARTGGTAAGNVQITGGTSGFSNSTAGGIQVAIGTLGSPTALTWGTAPFAPATFVLNETTAGGPITFLNNVALGTGARAVNVNASTATMSGTLTGGAGGTLTKAGAGTLVLSGPNTYTAGTVIGGGTLRAASTNAMGTGSVTFSASSTLELATDAPVAAAHNVVVNTGISATITANRATSGAGVAHTLGTLALNPTGGTSQLTVNLGANVTSGTAALTFGNVTATATTANRTTTFTPNNVNLTFTNTLASSQAATFTQTIALAGTGSTNVITNGITGGGGAGTAGTLVTKSGTSTWSLGGTSTYTGNTTINAGTLGLRNGGNLGATAVTVNAGTLAVLPAANGATNNLAGTLTLNAGSALTMADGATSTFNVTGASTLAPATGTAPVLTFDLGGGTSSDSLVIAGAATVGAGTAVINLNGVGSTAATGPYTIISAASGLGANFTLGTSRVVIAGVAYAPSLSTSTATQEIVTLTSLGIGAAYFTGNADAATLNAGGATTNWSSDAAGTTDVGAQPGSTADVFFTATSRTTPVAVTELGQSYTWNSLNFTAGAPTVSVADADAAHGITITPSGVTNAINDLSANNVTINVPLTLGAAQTWSNTGGGTLAFGPAATVANGGFALTVTGTGNTTVAAAISGTGGLVKSGTGTLTLNAANAYSGSTTILDGTIATGVTNALPTASALIMGNTSGATGALNLPFDQTIPSLTVSSISANSNTITVAPGRTLTVNGNVLIGPTATATNQTSKLTIGGGGNLAVTTAAGGTFLVGGNNTSNSFSEAATLDLTGLATASINASATGTVRVNNTQGTNTAGNFATLLLPTPAVAAGTPVTSITAQNFNVGDSAGNGGGAGQINSVVLGTGLTTLRVDNMNIGTGTRDVGSLTFAAGNGTVNLRAANGTGRTAFSVGGAGGGTGVGNGTGVTGMLADFTDHPADLLVGTLTVGNQGRTSTQNYDFKFNTGTLDATGVVIANDTVATTNVPGAAVTLTSTVALSGGTTTIGTGGISMGTASGTRTGSTSTATAVAVNGNFNVSGGTVNVGTTGAFSVRLGNLTTANTFVSVTDTFAVSGGTVTLAGPIVSASQGTRTTANLSLTGGTLNMAGNNIGGGTTATNLTAITFSGGTLRNVGSITQTLSQTGTSSVLDVLANNASVAGAYSLTDGKAAVAAGRVLDVTGTVTLAGTYQVATTATTAGRINAGTTSGDLNLASLLDVLDVRPTAVTSGSPLIIATYTGSRNNEVFNTAMLNGSPEGAPVITAPGAGLTLHTYADFAVLYDDNAKNVQLTVTNVPEPTAVGLAAAGAGLLALRRRRRPAGR